MTADAGRDSRVLAGRYALSSVLGRGGMGVVWLASDRVLDRQVAIKELTFPPDFSDEERAVLRERTLREARAAARLDHPCVVRVHDVVQEDGRPWLVMEHVRSRTLQQIVETQGPLPPDAAARIGLDVLDALQAAHLAGIVHRDVKPSNILVADDGRARLTDFGIAMTTGDSSLTTHGALIGSPSYMAPERAHGDPPGPAMDQWSLGATLYAAVEGRPPFRRDEPMATLFAVVSEHPAPMVRAGPLEPVLRGLLTKEPARRTTAEQARGQLHAVAASAWPVPSPPSPPPSPGPAPRVAAGALRGSMQKFEAEDLRALASASRAVLGSVTREAVDQARSFTERRRERKEREAVQRPGGAPRRRRRMRRRWIVVPVLVTVVLVLALLGGAAVVLLLVLGLL